MPSGEKLYGQMGQRIELVGHNDERYYCSSKDEAKLNSVTVSSMVVVASCSWDVVLLEARGTLHKVNGIMDYLQILQPDSQTVETVF